jgi:hypothetical protein
MYMWNSYGFQDIWVCVVMSGQIRSLVEHPILVCPGKRGYPLRMVIDVSNWMYTADGQNGGSRKLWFVVRPIVLFSHFPP